ncbi:MAG: hypothetical protein HYY01_02780 [Chloroflexi bacterium]|nr:hypothetical protein [Chloroflexota bacterium]
MNIDRARKSIAGPALAAVVATGWFGTPKGTVEPAWYTLHVPRIQLALVRWGEVNAGPGELEVRDREYEATGAFRVTVNGSEFVAHEMRVASNVRVRDDLVEHWGAVEINVDELPASHLSLQYKGLARFDGSTIRSAGAFKVIAATGSFAGFSPKGHYGVLMERVPGVTGSPVNAIFAAVGH